MDRDSGLRPVLGLSQRGDGRPHPLQRPGLCRCAQAGPEGEAGLNVCVWKAARPWRAHRLLLLRLFITLPSAAASAASAGLEPVLTGWSGGGRWEAGPASCTTTTAERQTETGGVHGPAAVHTEATDMWAGLSVHIFLDTEPLEIVLAGCDCS